MQLGFAIKRALKALDVYCNMSGRPKTNRLRKKRMKRRDTLYEAMGISAKLAFGGRR